MPRFLSNISTSETEAEVWESVDLVIVWPTKLAGSPEIASAMDIEYTLIKNISDLDKLLKKISTIKRPKLVIEIQSYNDQLVEPSVISKLNEMGKFETPEISEMYPPIDY